MSVSAATRRLVIARAKECCEYCRVHQQDRVIPYAIDHIFAVKHGGSHADDNLAYCCRLCNGHKGTDIASIDWRQGVGVITGLFHPRQQHWDDHFRLNGVRIEPLTDEAYVASYLLQLNERKRLIERAFLMESGRYPCRSL